MSTTILLSGGSPAADRNSVSRASDAFAIDFYKQAGVQPGNLVFSPYSISAALAMAYAGAAGATADQMRKAMHWTEPATRVAAEFARLDNALAKAQTGSAVRLSIANSLWPQTGCRFRQEFLDVLAETFKTSLHEADFVKQPEQERVRINKWVERQTRDKIKDLMPAGSIGSLTRLVLANAVYFKAKWQQQFESDATRPAPFYLASGGSVRTPLMAQTAQFRYAAAPGLKLLAMPYQGGELSMIVLLPDDANGLPQLEQQLSGARLEEWIGALQPGQVSVFLPKFKVTFELELSAALSALGMADAFSAQQADFSGMTGDRSLFISSARHKAFVEVNEEGTEAAAATGLAYTLSAVAPPKKILVFRADHPFLYLIRHNPTGTILFLGRLNDPAKPA